MWLSDDNIELNDDKGNTYDKVIKNINDAGEAIKCSATVKSITEVGDIESASSSDYPLRMLPVVIHVTLSLYIVNAGKTAHFLLNFTLNKIKLAQIMNNRIYFVRNTCYFDV